LKKEPSKKYRRIQILRILIQAVFFFLFFYLLLQTRFPDDDYIGRVEIFFHFDPLLALTTFLASHVFFASFILALITLVFTIILGRFFCGWFCPLGTIHQFFAFLFKKTKFLKPKIYKDNHTVWKYYLLIVILVGTVFSLNLVGILDPFSLLYRSFAVGFLPAIAYTVNSFIGILYQINWTSLGDVLVQVFEILDINTTFIHGFFLSTLFLGLILLNMTRERFWCRYLCPLGALLGLAARWNVLKLRVDQEKCIECGLCYIVCEDASHQAIAQNKDENGKRRYSVIEDECVGCNLCYLVCPVPDCITMEPQDTGLPYLNWGDHPNNPIKAP